jgi:hypothetical protein
LDKTRPEVKTGTSNNSRSSNNENSNAAASDAKDGAALNLLSQTPQRSWLANAMFGETLLRLGLIPTPAEALSDKCRLPNLIYHDWLGLDKNPVEEWWPLSCVPLALLGASD